MGFPGGSDGKESACREGDLGLISGLGRSPGEGNGNPVQYSCLENPMDRRAWPWGCKELDMTEQRSTHTLHGQRQEWLSGTLGLFCFLIWVLGTRMCLLCENLIIYGFCIFSEYTVHSNRASIGNWLNF